MAVRVTRQSWIFAQQLFEQEVAGFKAPNEVNALAKSLTALTEHWSRGTLHSAGSIRISETKAEQAFNRLLFEDGLGFRGLLERTDDYTILPQVSFPYSHGGRSDFRTDLAIGHFSAMSHKVDAVLELKNPDANLEKPQSGKQYRHPRTGKPMSAIDQALETMRATRSAQWALVSNMRELWLFHESTDDAALWTDLTTVQKADLPRLVYAFGYGGFISKQTPRLELLRQRTARLS